MAKIITLLTVVLLLTGSVYAETACEDLVLNEGLIKLEITDVKQSLRELRQQKKAAVRKAQSKVERRATKRQFNKQRKLFQREKRALRKQLRGLPLKSVKHCKKQGFSTSKSGDLQHQQLVRQAEALCRNSGSKLCQLFKDGANLNDLSDVDLGKVIDAEMRDGERQQVAIYDCRAFDVEKKRSLHIPGEEPSSIVWDFLAPVIEHPLGGMHPAVTTVNSYTGVEIAFISGVDFTEVDDSYLGQVTWLTGAEFNGGEPLFLEGETLSDPPVVLIKSEQGQIKKLFLEQVIEMSVIGCDFIVIVQMECIANCLSPSHEMHDIFALRDGWRYNYATDRVYSPEEPISPADRFRVDFIDEGNGDWHYALAALNTDNFDFNIIPHATPDSLGICHAANQELATELDLAYLRRYAMISGYFFINGNYISGMAYNFVESRGEDINDTDNNALIVNFVDIAANWYEFDYDINSGYEQICLPGYPLS